MKIYSLFQVVCFVLFVSVTTVQAQTYDVVGAYTYQGTTSNTALFFHGDGTVIMYDCGEEVSRGYQGVYESNEISLGNESGKLKWTIGDTHIQDVAYTYGGITPVYELKIIVSENEERVFTSESNWSVALSYCTGTLVSVAFGDSDSLMYKSTSKSISKSDSYDCDSVWRGDPSDHVKFNCQAACADANSGKSEGVKANCAILKNWYYQDESAYNDCTVCKTYSPTSSSSSSSSGSASSSDGEVGDTPTSSSSGSSSDEEEEDDDIPTCFINTL